MKKSFENIINYTNVCALERTCDRIICKDNLANYHNLINHSIIIVTEKKSVHFNNRKFYFPDIEKK